MKKLKVSEVAKHRLELAKSQCYRCGLCATSLVDIPQSNWCLDHDHRHGHVRAVLCRNCNGIEGKIYNLANRGKRKNTPEYFLHRLLDYWNKHSTPSGVLHPSHKTPDEKRIATNAKARVARAKKAALKNVSK